MPDNSWQLLFLAGLRKHSFLSAPKLGSLGFGMRSLPVSSSEALREYSESSTRLSSVTQMTLNCRSKLLLTLGNNAPLELGRFDSSLRHCIYLYPIHKLWLLQRCTDDVPGFKLQRLGYIYV